MGTAPLRPRVSPAGKKADEEPEGNKAEDRRAVDQVDIAAVDELGRPCRPKARAIAERVEIDDVS